MFAKKLNKWKEADNGNSWKPYWLLIRIIPKALQSILNKSMESSNWNRNKIFEKPNESPCVLFFLSFMGNSETKRKKKNVEEKKDIRKKQKTSVQR